MSKISVVKQLTIFAKNSILDVWEGSEYASAVEKYLLKANNKNKRTTSTYTVLEFLVNFDTHWSMNSVIDQCFH